MTRSASWIQHTTLFNCQCHALCHECFSPIVWPKALKKCGTNVVPLKIPMPFQYCSQLLVVARFPAVVWDHFPSQNKMLPVGSHGGKKNVSVLTWKFPALLCKIHTSFTMDTSGCLQLRRKTWRASHWQQGISSPSNALNLGQLSWENSVLLNVRLCKMQIEEKIIAAYLNEEEEILPHDTHFYFCLSVSVSVPSDAFVHVLDWFCSISYASPAQQRQIKVTLSRQGCWAAGSCCLPTRLGQAPLQDI